MTRRLILFCIFLVVMGLSDVANALLWDRGGGLIYDDVLDITWLQDANYAGTSGYEYNGKMRQNDALTWTDNLEYGGYDDWRLPTVTVSYEWTEVGAYPIIASSEMGYLYHNYLLLNTGPFINITPDYWLGYTEHVASSWLGDGLFFTFQYGHGFQDPDHAHYVWAVHDGDVGAPAPIPGAIWLFGSGLAGIFIIRNKKRRSAK